MISARPLTKRSRLRQTESTADACATLSGSRFFQASSAACTFCAAVSRVNGGSGGFASVITILSSRLPLRAIAFALSNAPHCRVHERLARRTNRPKTRDRASSRTRKKLGSGSGAVGGQRPVLVARPRRPRRRQRRERRLRARLHWRAGAAAAVAEADRAAAGRAEHSDPVAP